MIKNNTGMPEDGSNEITRQEKKAAKRKERLAKAIAKQDEALGIADKKPMTEISAELNQDDTPVENKSFTQYIDATKDPQKTTTVDNQTQETVEYDPGKAVMNAINNVSTNFTGSNVVGDIVRANKDLTFEQVQDLAGRAANVGELKAQQEKENQLVLQTEANALAEQVQQQTGEGVDIQTKETPGGVETTETITGGGLKTGGTGFTNTLGTRPIGPIVSTKGEPFKPSYEQVATKDKVQEDLTALNQQAMALDLITPDAVLEKLDVRDYYPEVGKDVAVGTWTGSVLGSQTIYSGAGTLLPMGLYDARKRAIATAAKQKQDIIDKMVELPNTADQFQRNYQEYGYENIIEAGLKKYGSYEKMVKSSEWRRDMARFKNLGIELSYADKQADVLLKALGEGKWVPKDIREAAYNLKNGMGDSIDDILNGKTSVLKYTSKLRSYENGATYINNAIKEGIFDENRLSEMPLNLKTSEAQENPKDYNDFIKSLSGDGSRDNDTYVTGVKKFFDISKVEEFVDNAIELNNMDPNTRDSMIDYMVAQIPVKTILTYHSMGNQDFERQRLASDNAWRQKEFDLKVKQGTTYYDALNQTMDSPNDNGVTLNNALGQAALNAKNMTQGQKRKAIKEAFTGSGFSSTYNPFLKTAVRTTKPSTQMMNTRIPVNSRATKVMIQEWDPNSKQYLKRTITVADLAAKKSKVAKNQIKAADGSFYTIRDIEDIQQATRSNTLHLKTQELYTAKGSVDKNGNLITVTETNLEGYNPNTSRNIHMMSGALGIKGAPEKDPTQPDGLKRDPATGDIIYTERPVKGQFFIESDISDESSRRPLDDAFGKNEVEYFKPSGSTTMEYSGSSSGGRQ